MKNLNLFLLAIILIAASCAKDRLFGPPDTLQGNNSAYNLISPQIKIAVVSDIHYMDPSIMPDDIENNADFQKYVGSDRKLLELSDPIFRKVVDELLDEKPDILLVAGDMAKDGELVCHQKVKAFLQQLENKGIKVYLVPGNNDINNPDAKTFKTIPASSTPTVTTEEFAELYGNFGYDEAIYRDENSLSYICQPHKNLWILGIDAIKYSESGVSGAINPSTMAWIQEKMTEARENNITVLAIMHYGIVEHYAGQKNLEPLIKSSKDNAIALMNSGIRLIFTGHYHATDVVDFTNEGKTLTDIQTGSLVTPPIPYRILTLDDNFINIDTRRITGIDSELPGGVDFLTYCNEAISKRLNSFFTNALRFLFMVPKVEAIIAAPYCAEAFKAYLYGDEKLSPSDAAGIQTVVPKVPSFPPLENILNSWYKDLPPKDNHIHIKLK